MLHPFIDTDCRVQHTNRGCAPHTPSNLAPGTRVAYSILVIFSARLL